MANNNSTRTQYEAVMDLHYAACFNHLNERFYRHLRTCLGLIQAALGAGAVATLLTEQPEVAAAAAVLTALAGVVDQVISPAERAGRFNEQYRRYTELEGRASQLSLEELDRELAKIRIDAPAYSISSLATHAYNSNVRSYGCDEYAIPMTLGQRIAAFLA